MTFEIGQWVRLDKRIGTISKLNHKEHCVTIAFTEGDMGSIGVEWVKPLRVPGEFKIGDEVEVVGDQGFIVDGGHCAGCRFVVSRLFHYAAGGHGSCDACREFPESKFIATNERLKLITPAEVMEAKKEYATMPSTIAEYLNTFPRPIKRRDVRVGDEISFVWEDGSDERMTVSKIDGDGVNRSAYTDSRYWMGFSLSDQYDKSHPLTLHSRKGECDEKTIVDNGLQRSCAPEDGASDGGQCNSQHDSRISSQQRGSPDKGDSRIPVCRGDIPTKPIPEGFKKVSLGGTTCIIPKADWKPKQPEEKSPEEIGFEGCDGYVFRVDAKNPYHLYAGIDKNQCDAGDRTHESLDIRIKKHLEAREK